MRDISHVFGVDALMLISYRMKADQLITKDKKENRSV